MRTKKVLADAREHTEQNDINKVRDVSITHHVL